MFSAVRGARVYRAEAAREQERFLLPKAESNTRTYLPPRSVSFSIHALPFRPDLPPSFYGALRRACLYLYPETYRSHGIISPLPFILFFSLIRSGGRRLPFIGRVGKGEERGRPRSSFGCSFHCRGRPNGVYTLPSSSRPPAPRH